MKLLVLGLLAGVILVYLIYNQCWIVHRCTPFPNLARKAEDRIYGTPLSVETRKVIEGMTANKADMPAFDEQANMEMDYIKGRKQHFGRREDDPKGMLDVDKELTSFKKLSPAGWENSDVKDISGNVRTLKDSHLEAVKKTDMADSQKQCLMTMKCGDLTDGKCGYCQSSGAYTTSNKAGTRPLTDVCEAGK